MVLRSGKEVDNKVSEKKHDKDERLETMESDLEIWVITFFSFGCLLVYA